MAKSASRLLALKMRREGESILEIAEKLGVSKASASLWCRNIELTRRQKDRLFRNKLKGGLKGRLIGAEVNKNKRLRNIKEQETIARNIVGDLTSRDMLMLGIALYWGEGTKNPNTSGTTITNSDPATVLFAQRWFEQLGVKREMFRPYIFINEMHKPREKTLLNFWSHYLDIPTSQFARTVFLKTKSRKIYENPNSYYGVLALRVRKSKTLKYRILGLIETCKEKAGVAQLVRA